MQPNSAPLPARKPAGSVQLAESSASISGTAVQQIRRIVSQLEAGAAERSIAQTEGVSESFVRRVRKVELQRRRAETQAAGVAVGKLLDDLGSSHRACMSSFMTGVRDMHEDIGQGVFEELLERGAA
jgi:hypothetical protein